MKESLHIDMRTGLHPTRDQSQVDWTITYVLNLPTPGYTHSPDADGGWSAVDPTEVISARPSLAAAVGFAREWAIGCGYKPGPTRIGYGNSVTIGLRRP